MKLFRFKKKTADEPATGEIVIIDDTPENLHLLNDILSERGYKVRALPNGQMGISACQASPPDLILLDINMPGMDGYEVARRLKEDAATRTIPIIFASAMSQTEDKVKAFQAGGVDYVTKPLQVEEVMARVETHLSISRMREQLNQANQKLLTWAVEISQGGSSAGAAAARQNPIPAALAERFGKTVELLAEGDRVETAVSVIALCTPTCETISRLAEEFESNLEVYHLARFSGITVMISPLEIDQVSSWLEKELEDEELSASVCRSEGLLVVVADPGGLLRLDFRSPDVLPSLQALAAGQDQ